jgi:hypothetical protein
VNFYNSIVNRVKGLYLKGDWASLKQCDILYISRDSDRPFIFDGRYYSPLIDSLRIDLQKFNFQSLSMALPYSTKIHDETFGMVLQFNLAYLIAELNDKLISILFCKQSRRYRSEFWKKILKLTSARIVISIHPNRDLIVVCRNLNIGVYDLQHGVISGENYYSKRVWEVDSKKIVFPDFLLWDQSSEIKLKKLLAPYSPSFYIIGNPWIRRLSSKTGNDIFIDNLKLEFEKKITKKHCILLTLQYGKGIIGIEDTINDYLIDIIHALRLDCQWLIKLHPAQCTGREYEYAILFLKNKFKNLSDVVEWDATSKLPLPILMQISTLHITFNSGSAIEAYKMGLNTGLLDRRSELMKSWFGDYMKCGLIEILPENKLKFISWIYKKSKRVSFNEKSVDEDNGYNQFISTLQSIGNNIHA